MDMRRYTYRTELHAHTSPASMCGKIPETSFDIAKILRSRDYYYEIGGGVILPYGLSGGMGE